MRGAAELIRYVYGLAISPGTLVASVGEARTALQSTADLVAQYLRATALVNADGWAARRSGKRFSDADIAAFRTLCDAIVGASEALHPKVELPIWKGGRAKQSVACKLLRRLRKHADAILLFIGDLALPFTNDVAERAVRMSEVKQKISGCLRTVVGADNFCVIRFCLGTRRKQGYGMPEVLQRAFAGNPIRPAAWTLNSHPKRSSLAPEARSSCKLRASTPAASNASRRKSVFCRSESDDTRR